MEAGFTVVSLVLYQPDEIVGRRVTVEALADFAKDISAIATSFFAASTSQEILDIVIAIKPGKQFKVWYVSARNAGDPGLRDLRTRLASVTPPEVRDGPVIFGVMGAIGGAQGRGTVFQASIPSRVEGSCDTRGH